MSGARSQPTLKKSLASSRYELLFKIASGGMATVYVGRLMGSVGFSRLVAIKRAHPHLVEDRAARFMLIEEASLASKLHHANVVAVQDVEDIEDELLLVMDYVEGGSLAELLEGAARMGREVPPRIGLRIALDACAGLHAVHDLTGDDGRPHGLVHRDVSPQNILVGVDGTSRLSDFGVAKPAEGITATTGGMLKGKTAYLSPEYINGALFTPRSDLFAMAVVIWEVLTNRRLFRGDNEAQTLLRIVGEQAPPPSSIVPELGPEIDAVIAQALDKQPDRRQRSVLEFAAALEAAARRSDLLAMHTEVGMLVRGLIGDELARRRDQLRAIQSGPVGEAIHETVSMLHAIEETPSALNFDPPGIVDEADTLRDEESAAAPARPPRLFGATPVAPFFVAPRAPAAPASTPSAPAPASFVRAASLVDATAPVTPTSAPSALATPTPTPHARGTPVAVAAASLGGSDDDTTFILSPGSSSGATPLPREVSRPVASFVFPDTDDAPTIPTDNALAVSTDGYGTQTKLWPPRRPARSSAAAAVVAASLLGVVVIVWSLVSGDDGARAALAAQGLRRAGERLAAASVRIDQPAASAAVHAPPAEVIDLDAEGPPAEDATAPSPRSPVRLRPQAHPAAPPAGGPAALPPSAKAPDGEVPSNPYRSRIKPNP